MKKYLLLIIVNMLFIPNVFAERISVTLNKCVDGDTAVFNINEEEKKFRFLAIDTPESVKVGVEVQPFGKEASEYTCDRLTNGNIEIEYDEKGTHEDKYGRGLAWIYVDGSLLQEELVSRGYAEVAYVYYKYSNVENLCNVQAEAKEKNEGIWSLNRKEGYCSTGSNAKVEEEKTNKKDKVSTTKQTNRDKAIKYASKGQYDKAILEMLKDSTNIYVTIFLILLLVLALVLKNKKRRKR